MAHNFDEALISTEDKINLDESTFAKMDELHRADVAAKKSFRSKLQSVHKQMNKWSAAMKKAQMNLKLSFMSA